MTAEAGFSGRSLRMFSGAGYDKGQSYLVQALWFATSNLVFMQWWCPRKLRPLILRLFGAAIGERVFIRHRVRVLWPWKLSVGDDSWIGEDSFFLNLEPITIGRDVCISQKVLLCTGGHQRYSPSFEYDNGPIVVDDHAWLAVDALVLRGVSIGRDAVVAARALVTRDVQAGGIVRAGQVW